MSVLVFQNLLYPHHQLGRYYVVRNVTNNHYLGRFTFCASFSSCVSSKLIPVFILKVSAYLREIIDTCTVFNMCLYFGDNGAAGRGDTHKFSWEDHKEVGATVFIRDMGHLGQKQWRKRQENSRRWPTYGDVSQISHGE